MVAIQTSEVGVALLADYYNTLTFCVVIFKTDDSHKLEMSQKEWEYIFEK
jgi:hypothetical protein